MPRKTKTIIFLLAIAIFAMLITSIAPEFTGYSVQDPNSYDVLILEQNFSSNEQIALPFDAPLTTLRATGTVTGSGMLEIILSNGTENYTVYSLDTYTANQLTGFVAKRTEMIVPISPPKIKLNKTNLTEPEINITINTTINSSENITTNITINSTENMLFNLSNNTGNISFNETEINVTINQTVEINNSLTNESNSTQENIIDLPIEEVPIELSEDYMRLFTEHCQDTCWLPSIKNATLYINIEGNISLHLQDLSYQLLYPIVQHTNISDQIIIANEVSIINLKDYFKHYNSLIFDLPEIVGIDARIINDHQLLLTGNTPGDYRLFVYATNGKDLYRSNEFVVSILPAENTSLVNETLIPLDEDLLKEIKENGNARILVKSINDQFATTTNGRVGIQSTIDHNQAKKTKEKKQDVYLLLKEKHEQVKVKQITNDYVAVNIDEEQLLSLANQEGVQEIILDTAYSLLLNDVMNLTNTTLMHEQGWGGAGQKICIIDTGAQTQYFNVNNSQITAYNIFDGSTNITDTLGHGTAITYAATKIAPEANYVLVKVVDNNGIAYASDIVNSLDYCQSQNANIISISLGAGSYSGYCDQDTVAQKINSINDSLVLVATGNDGMQGYITSPSCASNALVVGASTKQDTLSTITNYNDATLLLAPGENVNTINHQGTYISLTGTSISTPVVAGVAALALENNTYNSDQLKKLLVHTGEIISTPKRYFSRIDSSNLLNQYVTNNLSSQNVSLVNGSEENFTTLAESAIFEDYFDGSPWTDNWTVFSGESGEVSLDTNRLKIASWHTDRLNAGNITWANYTFTSLMQCDSVDNNYDCSVIFAYESGTDFLLYGQKNGAMRIWDQSDSELGTTGTEDIGNNDLVWYKVKLSDDRILARHWAVGASEPSTWELNVSTPAGDNVGAIGVGIHSSSASYFDNVTVTQEVFDSNVTATEFDGSTTDFAGLSSGSVTGLTLDNSSNGKIVWADTIDVTNMNYDVGVEISSESIYVDTTLLSLAHNSTANLSIYGLTYLNPQIYKDGSSCSTCEILSYSGGTLLFNVTGFSNYTVQEGPHPEITAVSVSSDSGIYKTMDNLSVSITSNDSSRNITDWRVNGTSIAILNLPFDTNVSSNTSGAVHDYTTYKNNATLAASSVMPTWQSNCIVGGCYDFDGSSDRMSVANSSSLNVTNKLTLSAWVYRNANQSSYRSIITRPIGTGIYETWWLGFKDNQYNVYMRNSSSDYIAIVGGVASNMQWIHMAATYDGSNVKLYVDGNYVTQEVLTGPLISASTPIDIAAGTNDGGSSYAEYFNGKIDEVLVLDKVLSPEQITALYDAGVAGKHLETIITNETAIDDKWSVAVTPNNGTYEGTTFLSNNVTIVSNVYPTITSASLSTATGLNGTKENITLSLIAEDTVTNITDWRVNGSSIAVLNMPFDTNVSSTSSGAVRDYSSYGNNGTLGDGNSSYVPTWTADCQVGGCYYFDGTNSDVIIVNDSSSLTLGDAFSASFWINPQAAPGFELVFNKEATGDHSAPYDTYAFYSDQYNSDRWTFGVNGSQSISIPYFTNTWSFISVTFDPSIDTAKIYRDGQLLNESTGFTNDIVDSPYLLYIGNLLTGDGDFYGYIDELMFFDRVLSPEQINASYQAGLAGKEITTIVSNETNVDDNWSVELTPNDGSYDGSSVISNALIITNNEIRVDENQNGTFETLSCNSTYNGALCDIDNDNIANGVCVGTACDISAPAVLNCGTDGCTSADMGASAWTTCSTSSDGESCDNSFGSFTNYFFTQDGICVDGATNTCDTSAPVAYNGASNYASDCASGFECDNTLSNGDYVRDGYCALTSCCTSVIVSGEYTSPTWDNGNEACTCTGNDGELCDVTPTTGPSTEGTCVIGTCISGTVVDGDQDGLFETAGCSSTYNGSLCDTDNDGVADGVCVGTACDTLAPSALNCGIDGCTSADMGASAWTTCSTSSDGESCDNSFGSFTNYFFTQSGICSSTACVSSGYVFYDGTIYDASTNIITSDYDADSDHDGESCDSIITSGGDYDQTGMLTMSGCSAIGSTVRVDASNNDYFVVGCDSSGDGCDNSIADSLTAPFVFAGVCASNSCDAVDVVNNGGTYYGNCDSYGGKQCDADTSNGAYYQTGMCFDNGGKTDGINFDCETSEFIFYDDKFYDDNSAVGSADYDYDSDSDGKSCDKTLTSGGDYSSDGLLVYKAFALHGDCVNHVARVDAKNNNYFTSGCDYSMDLCDTAVDTSSLTAPFTANGRCASGGCQIEGAVFSSKGNYYTSCQANADDCDSGRIGTNAYEQDGICVTGGTCDTGDVCYQSSTYYGGMGSCSEGAACDSDVAPSYSADGIVFTNDGTNLCCNGGEDYEDTAGSNCCYNGGLLTDGSSSASVQCVAGNLFDCGSQVTTSPDSDTNDAACQLRGSLYCDTTTNIWTSNIPNDCGVCSTGDDCTSGLCIEGTCRDSCDGYTTASNRCSDGAYAYTLSGTAGVCVYNGTSTTYYCKGGEIADDDATAALALVDDCALANFRDQCDSDLQGEFTVDGVCGNTLNQICLTNYASNINNGLISPTIGTTSSSASDVCDGYNAYYCDDVSDGNWNPGTKRCDDDDNVCDACDDVNNLGDDGNCESVCGADASADELPSSTCDGTNGYVGSNCTYYTEGDSNTETCSCVNDVTTGGNDQGKEWGIGGEVAPTTCCGDDSGEYDFDSLYAASIDSSPTVTDACCNTTSDCVFSNTCYISGYISLNVDGDLDNDYCNAGIWADCNTDAECNTGYYCGTNDCLSSSVTVNYTQPTPVDNDREILNSVTINVTVLSVGSNVDTCLLEWQGGNESMTKVGTGTSVTCYKTKTTVDGTNYTYNVYANNTVGSFDTENERSFLENIKPSITLVNITPNSPTRIDDLNCSVSGWSDVDGDGECYYFTWYKNDVLNLNVYQTGTSYILASGNTSLDDVWNCSVTPYDGYENGTSLMDSVVILGDCSVDDDCPSGECISNYCISNPGQFVVKNSSGNRIAIIDNTGRMIITGILTQSCVATPETNDFIIQTTSGVAAWIDGASGNLCVGGSLSEDQTSFTPDGNDWLIANNTGDYVAMVEGTSDNFLLRRNLITGAVIT